MTQGRPLPFSDREGRTAVGPENGESRTPASTTEQQPNMRQDRAEGMPPRSDGMPRKNVEVEQRPHSISDSGALLDASDSQRFRTRWDSIQAQFVDEPRKSVTDAQKLLTEVLDALDKAFAKGRDELESQWQRSGDVSTEDLRTTVQKYRTLFQRLLAA